MARHKAGELYRPQGKGTWHYWLKGFGKVDTGQTDRWLAELHLKRSGGAVAAVASATPQPMTGGVEGVTAPLISALHALNSGVASPTPGTPTAPPTVSPTPTATTAPKPTDAAPTAPAPSDKAGFIASKLKFGQKEKIIAALSKGCAHIDALLVEGGFRIFGRRIKDTFAGIGDDDLEIMRLGFDMMLEDLFSRVNPKPWHLVLVGNILLVVTVLPHTERVPRKPKLQPVEDNNHVGTDTTARQ